MLKKWIRARFLFESVWGCQNFRFYKTLKSISVRKSWNYCTSASSNHDLSLNHQLKKCHSISNHYLFFFFFACFFVDEERWPIRVVVLLHPSILLGTKRTESRSNYLQDKVRSNREIRNEETFRIFCFLGFGFGGQSDRKWNGRRECKV